MAIRFVILFALVALISCDDSVVDISIINTNNGKQLVISRDNDALLSGTIGVGRNYTTKHPKSQQLKITKKNSPYILEDDGVVLTLELDATGIRVTWQTKNMKEVLRDCFDLNVTRLNWYGGPQRYGQVWPLQKMVLNGSEPYVIRKSDNFAVAERYWLNSKGAYIFIDDRAPLFVDQNLKYKDEVCFTAKAESPYIGRERIFLKYYIGIHDDPKKAHLHAVNLYLGKPKGHPNEKMIREPIWTTWPKYKEPIDDSKIIEFTESIIKHGYKGQIEIDADWETCYGAHVFKPDKFKNISNIVKNLKSHGYRVTLWIHPFVNNNCENYSTIGKQRGYFVKNPEGDTKAIWWFSNDAHQIDFTKAEAAKWFSDRIALLIQNPGVDSFKFDAGETDYAIPPSKYDNVDPELVPNILTQKYVETCSAFGDLIEVRSAWRTQGLPVFLRMIDKESSWGVADGLYTLVTTLLQMNMNGYGMVLPDMIGGNGYAHKPTAELIVRWTQANALMPAMQFGYLPWDYPSDSFDTAKIVQKFIKLHEDYSGKIIAAMQASIQNGTPVNSPIWWIDPKDNVALRTDDEFLLGEDILVAPVLKEHARNRTVYLPKGTWKDGNTGTVFKGPITLIEHPADISTLPFFILQK